MAASVAETLRVQGHHLGDGACATGTDGLEPLGTQDIFDQNELKSVRSDERKDGDDKQAKIGQPRWR